MWLRSATKDTVSDALYDALCSRTGPDFLWDTTRRGIIGRPKHDSNGFIAANLLFYLKKLSPLYPGLNPIISSTEQALDRFRRGHLSYYWPLVGEVCPIYQKPFFSRFQVLCLSPDADDSALHQLHLGSTESRQRLSQTLSMYRADDVRFSPPKAQQGLAPWKGVFLTWLPEQERWHRQKLEILDLAVNAHLLWFLSESNALSTPGTQETVAWMSQLITERTCLTQPYFCSPNYPDPLLVYYILSRAIDFGALREKGVFETSVLEILCQTLWDLTPSTRNDRLLLALSAIHLRLPALFRRYRDSLFFPTLEPLRFYVAHLIPGFLFNHPLAAWLTTKSFTHIHFESVALSAAMRLWGIEQAAQWGE